MARRNGIVKTARGDRIDMAKLTRENPNEIAMTGGGLSMNARGDILGKGGKIVKTREAIERAYHVANEKATKHVVAKSVSIKKAHIAPDKLPEEKKLPIEEPKNIKKEKPIEDKEDIIEEFSLEDISRVLEDKKDVQEETPTTTKRKRRTTTTGVKDEEFDNSDDE